MEYSPRAIRSFAGTHIVAGIIKTFSFDIGEANRKFAHDEIHEHITRAADKKSVAGSERHLRAVWRLPNPTIRYNGSEWILVDDCAYAALDGCTIQSNAGSRPSWQAFHVFCGPSFPIRWHHALSGKGPTPRSLTRETPQDCAGDSGPRTRAGL